MFIVMTHVFFSKILFIYFKMSSTQDKEEKHGGIETSPMHADIDFKTCRYQGIQNKPLIYDGSSAEGFHRPYHNGTERLPRIIGSEMSESEMLEILNLSPELTYREMRQLYRTMNSNEYSNSHPDIPINVPEYNGVANLWEEKEPKESKEEESIDIETSGNIMPSYRDPFEDGFHSLYPDNMVHGLSFKNRTSSDLGDYFTSTLDDFATKQSVKVIPLPRHAEIKTPLSLSSQGERKEMKAHLTLLQAMDAEIEAPLVLPQERHEEIEVAWGLSQESPKEIETSPSAQEILEELKALCISEPNVSGPKYDAKATSLGRRFKIITFGGDEKQIEMPKIGLGSHFSVENELPLSYKPKTKKLWNEKECEQEPVQDVEIEYESVTPKLDAHYATNPNTLYILEGDNEYNLQDEYEQTMTWSREPESFEGESFPRHVPLPEPSGKLGN